MLATPVASMALLPAGAESAAVPVARASVLVLGGDEEHRIIEPVVGVCLGEELDRLLSDRHDEVDRPAVVPVPDEAPRGILGAIVREDVRATQIVQRHRTMLRRHELERQPVDLSSVVRESLALVAADAAQRNVDLDSELPATPCIVAGDQVLLQQVVVNLVMNAMDALAATPPARRRVVVRNAIHPDGVEISVRDACPDLFDKRNGTIFEPCVTTKATGLGIGLSIVRSIVEAHLRSIEARNVPEGGAVFRVTLPVHLSC